MIIHRITEAPSREMTVALAAFELQFNYSSMKENIVIPIKIERLKLWTLWTVEAAPWVICFGMLAASAVIAGFAAWIWLVSDAEIVLVLGLGSALLVGLAGMRHLLRQLDSAAKQLRQESRSVG